jgi:glycosidase
MQLRTRPILYEIPTWAWLSDLRARYRQPLTLGDLPAQEWDALAALQLDAVWFMGVWERSPMGIVVSNANPGLQQEFARALPDYDMVKDNVGSAYCVRNYVVDARLGGPEGLAKARAELARRGIGLVLDFVPNHIALDHPWTTTHPEYFVRGTAEDLLRAPEEFIDVNGQVLAHGRDPYFPPWRDGVQLNAFDAGQRAAAIETVNAIAAQCDGMRCDMAMLMLNQVFARTWGDRAGEMPATEYWREVIPQVKTKHPDAVFIAEAYWDLEAKLVEQGFDYCYDKRLYDRLEHENAASVRQHLLAAPEY